MERSRAYKISRTIAVLTSALAPVALGLTYFLGFNAAITTVLIVSTGAAWLSHAGVRCYEQLMACHEETKRRAEAHVEELRQAHNNLRTAFQSHRRTVDNAFRAIAMDSMSTGEQSIADGTHGTRARSGGPASGGTLFRVQ